MNRLQASFRFFTRLPIGRSSEFTPELFKRVFEFWPLIGWLTGIVTAAALYGASFIFPTFVAVAIALLVRVILTGALYEDSLADFCDGMGGGSSRERILAIMKDSRTGAYGVIGLCLYYLLMVGALSSIPVEVACIAIVAGDPWSKFCASQVISFLKYARRHDDEGRDYAPFSISPWLIAFIMGILPMLLLPIELWYAGIAPMVSTFLLIMLMKHKINGYTGDCIGACSMINELMFYLTITALIFA